MPRLLRNLLAVGLAIAGATWLIAVTQPLTALPVHPAANCPLAFGVSHLERDALPTDDWTLGMLTAYRRARGEPDPLAIEIVGETRISLPFPELPTFAVRLRNVDHEGRAFRILCGPYGPWHKSFRARPLDDPEWTFGPLALFTSSPLREYVSLQANESLRGEEQVSEHVSIPLAAYAFRDHPGSGRVRFRLEYGFDEAFFAHAPHPGCDGLAFSPPLEFDWMPVHVVADPSVTEGVRRLLEELGKTPGVEVRSPTSGRLEAWGVAALPALFEFLDEAAEDPRRRAEILVALHLASGLLDPTSRRYASYPAGPLGHYLLEPRPGWRSESDDGGPALDAQEALVERWDALRSLVVVVD